MSFTKRKIDKLDNERRKEEKNFISKKEYKLIKQEDNLITKDNTLIQKSKFNLTLNEMKCINYAISKLQPNKMISENDYLEIDIKELCDIMKIEKEGANYEYIRDCYKTLNDKSKWIKINDKGDELNFKYVMKVIANKNTGIIKIKFMQEMLDMLTNLHTQFTAYELYYSIILKSKYSLRLYEECKSWKAQGSFNLYIESIKNRWCISQKMKYGNIKQKIITPSIDEINNNTDIHIDYVEHKNGKKVDYLFIKISDNQISKVYNQANERRKKKKGYNYKITDYVDENNVMHPTPINE